MELQTHQRLRQLDRANMAITNFDGAAKGDLRKMPAVHQLFPLLLKEKYKNTKTGNKQRRSSFFKTMLNSVCSARYEEIKGSEKHPNLQKKTKQAGLQCLHLVTKK